MGLRKRSFFDLETFWKGSTLQLLGVIIVPLALMILVFAIGSTWYHQKAMRNMVGERDELAVHAAAEAIRAEVLLRNSELNTLLHALDGSEINIESSIANHPEIANTFDQGLAIFSSDGIMLEYTGDAILWRDISSNPLLSTGWSLFYTKLGDPILLFSAGTNNGLTFVGATSADDFARDHLNTSLPVNGDVQLFIVDQNGSTLYENDPTGSLSSQLDHFGFPEAFPNQTGTFYHDFDNVEYVISYSQIEDLHWILIMREPWESVSSPVLTTTQVAPLILVPLLILTLAGLRFGSRQIVEPLRQLEQRSEALVWGDMDQIEKPVGGIAEIRDLQNELIHLAKMVRSSQRGLTDYIGVITDTQEEERRRLARELHDDTLQSIIALKQRVQLARKKTSDDDTLTALAELETLTEQTIKDLRRMTRALRPIYLEDLGLVAALKMLAKETEGLLDINAEVQITGEEQRLSSAQELALYRVTQEALSNISRHASASTVIIAIEFGSEKTTLSIEDDGHGFIVPKTPTEFASTGHYGLLGMYERADLIGAKISVTSQPASGTKITLILDQINL